jgi:VanZ family protein
MSAEVTPLRFRTLWLAIGWSMVAVVVWLSLTPVPPKLGIDFDWIDKVEHVIAYFVLMGCFVQIYHATNSRLFFAVGFIVMGIGIEILQGLGGVRYFEYGDMVANTSGVLLGWLIGYFGIDRALYRIESCFR